MVILEVKERRLAHALRIILGVLKTADAAGARISLANGHFSKEIRTLFQEKDLEKTFIIIKKIPMKIIYYAMGWKLLKESGRIMKMCFCLWLVVVFLREILAIDVTLGNIYKFFNAVEKHVVIDGKYKIREKSLGQISSKIAYCKKLI